MLPAVYFRAPPQGRYLLFYSKRSPSMVRYPTQQIRLKLALDATSKRPTIIVTNQKPQGLPSADQFSYQISNEDSTVDEDGITKDKPSAAPPSNAVSFHFGEGYSKVKCSITRTGNRLTLSMEYGSNNFDQLFIETNQDPRRILGTLVGNHLAAAERLQLIIDKGIDEFVTRFVDPIVLELVTLIGKIDSDGNYPDSQE